MFEHSYITCLTTTASEITERESDELAALYKDISLRPAPVLPAESERYFWPSRPNLVGDSVGVAMVSVKLKACGRTVVKLSMLWPH